MKALNFSDIKSAHNRIKNFVKNTPIITNEILNKKLKAQVFFKCDNMQKTNSFKVRGVFNTLLNYQEKNGELPKKIVVVSSGNHAQAVAFACNKFKIPVLVYLAKNVAPKKIEATKSWGAEVVICEKRSDANKWAEEKVSEGYFFIHPSNNEDVIAGQGTACFEALQEIGEVDAVFAPIGGGGLITGSFLAAQGLYPQTKIFACEPLSANDANISVKENKIFSFSESPSTIADGARTLAVSPLCFEYLKKLSGILEISEEEILNWQNEFLNATNILIEPTSALAIAGCAQYLKNNSQLNNPKMLVIISGGNL